MFVKFLTSSIRFSAAFLYGATGEIITEKSGHLNLGIPGVMSFGGAVAVLTELSLLDSSGAGSPFLFVFAPILTSFLGGAAFGLLYSFLTVTLRVNQNVVGLALTTFGVGLSGYMVTNVQSTAAKVGSCGKYFLNLFHVTSENWFMQIFLSHGVLVYLAVAIAIVAHTILNKTRLGLHLRAVGENPATADAAGINVIAYKYCATVIGSGIAGMGGMFAIMDYMGGNWEYILEGIGWLCVALVIFTLWRPALAIPGSIVFGGLYIVSDYIKGIAFRQIELVRMLPYLITVVVLVLTSAFDSKNAQPPAALGIPYFREDR